MICLSFNKDLCYSQIKDKVITIYNKDDNSLIFTFPLPKENFIAGAVEYFYTYNYVEYIITPFKPNKPKFVPEGCSNPKLSSNGLYKTNNKKYNFYYIDTSILSLDNYEFAMDGKFKISKDEIPEPFWIVSTQDTHVGFWRNTSEIETIVKSFDENSALVTEEEMASIFALNNYDKSIYYVNDEMAEILRKNIEKVRIDFGGFGFDNYDLVVRSRENRKVYKLMIHDFIRLNADLYYHNKAFHYNENENKPFDVYSVLHENKNDKTIKLKL